MRFEGKLWAKLLSGTKYGVRGSGKFGRRLTGTGLREAGSKLLLTADGTERNTPVKK